MMPQCAKKNIQIYWCFFKTYAKYMGLPKLLLKIIINPQICYCLKKLYSYTSRNNVSFCYNLEIQITEHKLTLMSIFRCLHKTSTSNFRFSFKSGSLCNSHNTFIIPIVHGLGGLKTYTINIHNTVLFQK